MLGFFLVLLISMVSAIGCGGGGAQSAGGSPTPPPSSFAHSHSCAFFSQPFRDAQQPWIWLAGAEHPDNANGKNYQHRNCCCRNHAGHNSWLWILCRYHHADQSESGAKRECSGRVQSGRGRNREWQPGSDEQRGNRALCSSCGHGTCSARSFSRYRVGRKHIRDAARIQRLSQHGERRPLYQDFSNARNVDTAFYRYHPRFRQAVFLRGHRCGYQRHRERGFHTGRRDHSSALSGRCGHFRSSPKI